MKALLLSVRALLTALRNKETASNSTASIRLCPESAKPVPQPSGIRRTPSKSRNNSRGISEEKMNVDNGMVQPILPTPPLSTDGSSLASALYMVRMT